MIGRLGSRGRAALAAVAAVAVFGTVGTAAGASPPVGRVEFAGSFPAVAALVDATAPADNLFNGQYCGAALLTADTVLTAAHCVVGRSPERVDVVVGADNLCRDAPIDGARRRAVEISLHPNYDGDSARFDLALVRFGGDPVDVAPVPVGPADPDGPVAVALGWGRASSFGVPACRLMGVEMLPRPAEQCAAALAGSPRAFDPASMTCATPRFPGRGDTCVGDSGGPVVQDGVVVGITSWGLSCDAGVPGVYAAPAAWPGLGESTREAPGR